LRSRFGRAPNTNNSASAGKDHRAAVRALAFKWIRIVFRCWQERVAYDENRYLAALAKRGSSLTSVVAAAATSM
jgi:hypothetical protein